MNKSVLGTPTEILNLNQKAEKVWMSEKQSAWDPEDWDTDSLEVSTLKSQGRS
jgi:hypothetical protein